MKIHDLLYLIRKKYGMNSSGDRFSQQTLKFI